MEKLTLNAYAKINLHLDIVSKADNGYHEVSTVMQSVSLCDTVSVGFCNGEKIRLLCSLEGLPCDELNLAHKAAKLFFDKIGYTHGIEIAIEKRIPMAAGLAGGSTDAAAVLYALNELFERPLTIDELCVLGARLGADVPFCIVGGTKYADGFGERLHSFPSMPSCYIVVACAGEGVSTPWAYAALDKAHGDFAHGKYLPRSLDDIRDAVENQSVCKLASSMFNVFEDVISAERPMVNEIKSLLSDNGALSAMMSGSGPSVFGVFEERSIAEKAKEELCARSISAFVCEPTPDRF